MNNRDRSKPRISVIVSTYNGGRDLYECVKSFRAPSSLEFEVVIADDGSPKRETSETIERLIREMPQRVVHVSQEDLGFRLARSRNNAFKAAKGEILVFLDHDILVSKSFLSGVASVVDQRWFLGGRRVKLDSSLTEQFFSGRVTSDYFFGTSFALRAWRLRLPGWRYLFPLRNRGPGGGAPQPWKGMAGFCIVMHRSAFEAVDGFDGIYRQYGAEDWDIFARLSNAGFKAGYLPRQCTVAHLWHNEAPVRLDSPNYKLLDEAIAERRVRAIDGVSKITDEFRGSH